MEIFTVTRLFLIFSISLLPGFTLPFGQSPAGALPMHASPLHSSHIPEGAIGVLPSAYIGCGDLFVSPQDEELEQRIVELTNEERARHNLPPLKRNSSLDNTARYHAADLAEDRYINHDTFDRRNNSLVKVCDWMSRISTHYLGWMRLGENVAAGYGTPEEVVKAWMNSAHHRANILNGDFREVGVGYYQGDSVYGDYWVQDFGQRETVYPIIINAEAAVTHTPEVSLYIFGIGEWEEMRLRNNDEEWTPWQPFQENLIWMLPAYSGLHSVWVELRNGSTTTILSVDTITLDLITLGSLPKQITFTYSPTARKVTPPSVILRPLNTSSDLTLDWTLFQSGNWFQVTPMEGSTPGTAFTITPDLASLDGAENMNGTLELIVTSPQDIFGSPHKVMLSLVISE